jgi:hypothetical protein
MFKKFKKKAKSEHPDGISSPLPGFIPAAGYNPHTSAPIPPVIGASKYPIGDDPPLTSYSDEYPKKSSSHNQLEEVRMRRRYNNIYLFDSILIKQIKGTYRRQK